MDANPLGHAVARYAARLQPTLGDGHHVASALGAWLVLALAAPAATGTERTALEDVLGIPVEEAAKQARELLAVPHPAVATAAALWSRADVATPAWSEWQTRLGPDVDCGPVPSQEAADAWAAEHTLGLIERFPLKLTREVLFVLASGGARGVGGGVRFVRAPATDLGGEWAVEQVLRSPAEHEGLITPDPEAGELAVHLAESTDGLAVLSMIAAPEVPAATVLAAAHRLAVGWASGDLVRLSLFDLPRTPGHAWTLTETSVPTRAPNGREEACPALLPAWSATSDHDLAQNPTTGFLLAGRALSALADRPHLDIVGRQAALARYTRTGFEAATITVLAGVTSVPPEGIRREALLRFDRPYAVVAVASQPGGPWHGVPVFSAWVTEADEVS
jgi:hypothetical protein